MKLKSLIVFYIFSLAVWPCKDIALQPGVLSTHVIESQYNNGGTSQQDQCAVFCLCNCCGHQFVPSSEIENLLTLNASSFLDLNSYDSYPTFIFAHWQPPKAFLS